MCVSIYLSIYLSIYIYLSISTYLDKLEESLEYICERARELGMEDVWLQQLQEAQYVGVKQQVVPVLHLIKRVLCAAL